MSVGATKRIKWKGSEIGDYAYIKYEYSGNNDIRVIPRAKGVSIRSTKELGGGVLSIMVTAFVEKANRYSLEKFFNDLDSSFSLNEKGDLKIEDENGTLTLPDCYLENISQAGSDFRWSEFNLKFVKSL